MECLPSNTAAVILSAGSSGRMGIPKALLKLPGGISFLEHSVSTFFECGITCVNAVVHPTVYKVLEYRKPWFFDDVNFIINQQQEKGRLFSILTGLDQIGDCRFAFLHNVDQPFLSEDLLLGMMKKTEKAAYVVPAFEGNSGHPLLLEAEVIAAVKQSDLSHDLRSILNVFHKNLYHCLNPLVCENINTPQDYMRVFGQMP